jgi:hypothetical protein
MRPSFFSLYKRGRYLPTPDIGDDSDAAKKQRKETERFAVAALAFCLRHDEGFRRHFWEKICRVQGVDPGEMPRITDGDIEVEPHQWADLRLTSVNGTDRFMWVIEAKAGAPLAKKQNPTKDEFRKKGVGYGRLFRDAEAKLRTKMRYIVLGASKDLELPARKKVPGISVQQRSWADLLEGMPRKGIVKDLRRFQNLRWLGGSGVSWRN